MVKPFRNLILMSLLFKQLRVAFRDFFFSPVELHFEDEFASPTESQRVER